MQVSGTAKLSAFFGLEKNEEAEGVSQKLAWLQIAFRPDELKKMQLRADLEEKSLSVLIREKLFEVLQSPLL